MTLSNRYLISVLIREEWRLHSRLFGGRRFALFPAFVATIAAGAAAFFAIAGADTDVLLAGLHVVVAVLGLQVGTVGLVGRDAIEDLLGETTLLLFASRTLPVHPTRLLVGFLVKDVLYYAVLFLAPLCVGVLPLVVTGDIALLDVPLLFATVVGTFVVGVAWSFALIGVATRSRNAAVVVVVAVVAVVVRYGSQVLAVTPYGLLEGFRPTTIVASLIGTVGLVAIGVFLFDFERRPSDRVATDRFGRLHHRLGTIDGQGLLSKSILDVMRSSGGLWKVVFSQGLVFAVVVVLLSFLPNAIPIRLTPGIPIAAVLSLGTFTTYNWLCQFDDTRFYARYPIELRVVFRAKLLAFCLLAIPIGLAFIGLGIVVFGTGSMLVGIVIFPPLSLYVFGVTSFLAGLEPTELLFDTPVFAGFSIATIAVLLPLVVGSIAFPLAPLEIALGSIALSLVAGSVGVILYARSGARWHRKSMAGERRNG